MIVLALTVLGFSYLSTGAVVEKGIDFTGGTEIQIQVPQKVGTQDIGEAFPEDGTTVRTMSGAGDGYRWVVIETMETFAENQRTGQGVENQIASRLQEQDIEYRGDISVRTLGAAVGGAFFQQAVFWSGVALLIMSTVIFVAFRTLVPSLAVIFAALTDILVAMAGMSILHIPLTLGSLAALLMLLGYSVDTDILLSTRVLNQHKKSLVDRIGDSVITGSTMTLAAIAAFSVLYLVSTAKPLDQISAVIVIGLTTDLPVTWLGNAVILKWYVGED